MDEGGAGVDWAGVLVDRDTFCRALAHWVGRPAVGPDDPVASVLMPHEVCVLYIELEEAGCGAFPEELIEDITTIDELWGFAAVKLGQEAS